MTEIETNEVQNETKKNKTSHKQVIIGFVIGFLISATISLSIGMALLKNIDIKTIIILNKCQDIINQICIYDIDRQVAQENIIKAYLKGLDDIYTEYYTPKEAEEISTHYEGEEFCGIGCLIDPDPYENGYYKISSLIEGGAKDAGVKSNSFIKNDFQSKTAVTAAAHAQQYGQQVLLPQAVLPLLRIFPQERTGEHSC